MKIAYLTFSLGLTLSVSSLAQQPTPSSSTEEIQRRLRRTETRTTTAKLYPERDTILALLKTRMAVLHPGTSVGTSPSTWFTDEARITDSDGSQKSPAEYQAVRGKTAYVNYRVRKLEINEKTARATETFSLLPVRNSTVSPQQATATSQLRKDTEGRWRITEMRVTTK
ncbi:hypothetical protein ACO2Q8_17960 [Larkinella sp. VNQ87]|uniref:hypothetical protein n=1 Tax=Larkinella sp. VNQ87 TaxID=3400921 RepID=UPI003C09A331